MSSTDAPKADRKTSPKTSPKTSKAALWTATAIFTAVILLICVVIVEFGLRMVGLGDPMVYEHNPAYGYAPRPNQQKERLRGSMITVNESGLRSRESWTAAEGQTRVLFLGDSVTWGGTYIDDGQTFSALVCDGLGEGFTCGNGGVNAYGVLNMVLRSRYDSRLEGADVVVFNVIRGDFLRGIQNSGVAHYFLHEPTGPVPAIAEALSYVAGKYNINHMLSKRQDPPSDEALFRASQLGAIAFAAEALNTEVARLEAMGKKVFVFYSPDVREAKGEESDPVQLALREAILASVPGIHDMTAAFKPGAGENYYDIVHYEVPGHRVAAGTMLPFIREALAK